MTKLKREELLGILGIRFAGVCSKEEAGAYEQIKALIEKPGVTKEFMEKWAKVFAESLYSDMPPRITRMLKEVDVHVL